MSEHFTFVQEFLTMILTSQESETPSPPIIPLFYNIYVYQYYKKSSFKLPQRWDIGDKCLFLNKTGGLKSCIFKFYSYSKIVKQECLNFYHHKNSISKNIEPFHSEVCTPFFISFHNKAFLIPVAEFMCHQLYDQP